MTLLDTYKPATREYRLDPYQSWILTDSVLYSIKFAKDIEILTDRPALLPSHFLRTAAGACSEKAQRCYAQVATGGARRLDMRVKITPTAAPALDLFPSNG